MIERTEALSIALTKEPKYEVFSFCKENGIKCGHDFNTMAGVRWTEIYFEGRSLMQVDHTMAKDQFIKLMNRLSDKATFDEFKRTKIIEDDGPDFWIALKGWSLFERFINKMYSRFNRCSKDISGVGF